MMLRVTIMNVKNRIISLVVCLSLMMSMICTVSAKVYGVADIPGKGQVWSAGVYGEYGYAVVGNGSENGLYVVKDIDSDAIAFGDRLNGDAIVTDRRNAYVAGDYLFYSSNENMYIYKVSDTPLTPKLVKTYNEYKQAYYFTSSTIGGKEYVYVCYGSGVAIFELGKVETTAPTVVSVGRTNAVAVSQTHIYAYSDKKIISCKMTYGNTISYEKKSELALGDDNDISPGSAVYVDGYVCISDQRGSSGQVYGGSILLIDAKDLDEKKLTTYRYYSRGSQAAQISANVQMPAMEVYNGLLVVLERCHNAKPSMALALDISDPKNIVTVWESEIVGGPVGVFIDNDTLITSLRGDGLYLVPIDTGAFCKITSIKTGDIVTKFPFAVSGTAVGASSVELTLGKNKVDVPVKNDGSWSFNVGYCENGKLDVVATVDDYSVEKSITVSVSEDIVLDATITKETVPQGNLVDGNLVLNVQASNTTDSSIEAMLYSVLYDGDDIVSITPSALSIDANADDVPVIVDLDYNVNLSDDSALKIFVVTKSGDIKLLSNVLEFTPDGYTAPVVSDVAEGSDQVNIDIEPDHTAIKAEILGTTSDNPEKNVLLTVYKPNATGLDGLDYINILKTNADGSFMVKYALGTPAVEEQNYTVKAAVRGIDGVWRFNGSDDTFKYYGPVYQSKALQAVNDATFDKVIGEIEFYNLVFGIDLGATGDYGLLGADSIYQTNVKNALEKQGFSSVSEVKPFFAKTVAAQKLLKTINEENDVSKVKAMIEKSENASLLGIDTGYLYSEIVDKNAVVNAVINGRSTEPYKTEEIFAEKFEQICAVEYINNTSYTLMAGALVAANKTLGLDLEGDYSKLDLEDEDEGVYVHKILDRTPFDTVEGIKSTFDSAVAEALNNKKEDDEEEDDRSYHSSGFVPGPSFPSTPDEKEEIPEPIAPDTQKPEEEKISFADMSDNHWAKPYAERLVRDGVITGYGNGTIKPDGLITRAEFIKILIGAYKLEDENYLSSFNDVQKKDKFFPWYYNCVATAQALGLVQGDDKGNFNPDAYITRQDMAVILNKMYKKQEIEIKGDVAAYTDMQTVSGYAVESVNTLTELGIMNGIGENKFGPKANVTRAMAFKVISLSLDMNK